MQVVRDEFRTDREELLIMADGVDVGPVRLVVVEVADVMAEEGMAAPSEGEGRLLLSAERQRRPPAGHGTLQRPRGVAPGATDRQLRPGDHARHRVVAAEPDRSVVRQETIGDAR